MCVRCHQTPAQLDRRFLRRCKKCFSADFPSREDAIVVEESRAYLEGLPSHQTWDGTERALQLLVLPQCGASGAARPQPLPDYDDEPRFLSPQHCRLCLQPYGPGQLAEHLRQCGQCTKAEYRHRVFGSVFAEWPQRIPAQVLRTRLAAFKQELCDANFKQEPCAAC